MASVETNDRKREEMAAQIIRLRLRGWTNSQLAAWMYVTPSTVSAWGRAASMGTNAQRAELAKLKSPAEERERICEAVRAWEREAAQSDSLATGAGHDGAHHVANSHRNRAARLRKRVALIRELFGC